MPNKLDGTVEIRTDDTSGIGSVAAHGCVAEGVYVVVADTVDLIGKLDMIVDNARARGEESAMVDGAKADQKQPHRQSPSAEAKQPDRWETKGEPSPKPGRGDGSPSVP